MEKTVQAKEKKRFRFPLYVAKKIGLPQWRYWLIRLVGVVLAFLLAGIICNILKPGTFGLFYAQLIEGCFDFSDISSVIDFLVLFSLLMLISLALVPAFKMKFWNIGAEGQILIACLVSGGIAKFAPKSLSNTTILIICAVCSILAGIVWSVIPAIFKALFNTNETLFTLMMNYIATVLGLWAMDVWIKSQSGSFGTLKQGIFTEIFDNSGTLVVLFALVIFVLIFFYMKKSIHGYELSVVGESVNTARYVGINVKKVIIRTMIFTGAIMGFIGFLIVCSINQTFNPHIVGGKGFTGVLIAWLGHFDPAEIAIFSFLSAFMEAGTNHASGNPAINMSSYQFTNICTGVFFFVIIACEFFSNYQIKRHHDKQFDLYFDQYKDQKKVSINSESNKFKRFCLKALFYISYPVEWIIKNIEFKKLQEKKTEEAL